MIHARRTIALTLLASALTIGSAHGIKDVNDSANKINWKNTDCSRITGPFKDVWKEIKRAPLQSGIFGGLLASLWRVHNKVEKPESQVKAILKELQASKLSKNPVWYAKRILALLLDVLDNNIIGAVEYRRGLDVWGTKFYPTGSWSPMQEIMGPNGESIGFTHKLQSVPAYGFLGRVLQNLYTLFKAPKYLKEGHDNVMWILDGFPQKSK